MTQRLLEELDGDCLERLKWLVCRRLGILPGSWGWYTMTARRVIRFACHLALDAREAAGFTGDDGESGAESEHGAAEGFDLERFRELGGEL